jgi:hypothetical protein
MQDEINFPQHRRYLNGKNYFRIFSRNSFEEIRSVGSKWIIETHQVKILPDRNFVEDLLFGFEGIAEPISSLDYDNIRTKAEK